MLKPVLPNDSRIQIEWIKDETERKKKRKCIKLRFKNTKANFLSNVFDIYSQDLGKPTFIMPRMNNLDPQAKRLKNLIASSKTHSYSSLSKHKLKSEDLIDIRI